MTKSRWIVVGAVVAIIVGTLWWKDHHTSAPPAPAPENEEAAPQAESPTAKSKDSEDRPIDLAQRADNQLDNQAPQAPTESGIPNTVVSQMKECFDMNTTGDPQDGSVTVEQTLDHLQQELGPPIKQGDLWTDWVVRMKDGSDRKVHLENIEDVDGHVRQTLMIFMIDPRGQPFPIPLDPKDKDRPPMDVATGILGQGETSKKEKAGYYQFARGERLEIIDVDGKPSEVEMVRDETLFRCDQLTPKPSCQCIK